jgi:hypothetical protein
MRHDDSGIIDYAAIIALVVILITMISITYFAEFRNIKARVTAYENSLQVETDIKQ